MKFLGSIISPILVSRIFSCSQNEKKSGNFELKMELKNFNFCSQNDLENIFSEAGNLVPIMGKRSSFSIPRSRISRTGVRTFCFLE